MSASLLDRVQAAYRGANAGRAVAVRASGKSFSEPPFWSLDSLRLPMLAASTPGRERVENNFEGYVQAAYKADGIIFACIIARMRVFAQARFGWRDENDDGTVGDLYTTATQRRLLRRPAPRLTLGNLLSLMEADASLAGNFYATTVDARGRWGATATGPSRRVVRLRPDWVWIIVDSPSGDPYALDAKVISYIYEPPLAGNGIPRSAKPVVLLPGEVVHYCADEETEILTADGWKDYKNLRTGDDVLTLNHHTGMSEWQPVSEVCVFPAQRREMILMEGHEFSSLTTLNHRWAVERKNSHAGGYVRRWATSESLSTGDRIPLAGYCADLPTDPKWTDALVETVAWFWTEGRYKSGRKPGAKARGIEISQSLKNPGNLDRIRAALTLLFGPPVARMSKRGPRADAPRVWREYLDDDMVIFALSANAADVVSGHAPAKVVTTDFLRSLTQAQLELFITVSMLADNSGEHRLAQKDKAAAEQFALACILAGKGVSIREKPTYHPRYGDSSMTQVRIRQSRHVYPQEDKRTKSRFRVERVTYDGQVWCPRTPNQTWLARRKGSVYFTGNSPVPDPVAQYRGMSWLTPVLREIASDKAATAHKLAFFERGATLQTVASLDKDVGVDAFDAFVARFEAQHAGVENAYGTLFLGGGADVTVIGTDLQRLDYKNVQGGGETRMAAAAGIHPTLVGLSEGLSGSSLNQGNFNAARRIFVDGTMRWLWGEAAASLETLFDLPNPDAYLDVDTRSIPFMREDAADAAEIMGKEATVLRTLGDGGWDPTTIVEAIRHRDWARLKHSGKLSVQLQPPGQQPAIGNGATNGNGAAANGVIVDAAKALMSAAWGDYGPR